MSRVWPMAMALLASPSESWPKERESSFDVPPGSCASTRSGAIVRDHAVQYLTEGAVASDGHQAAIAGVDRFLSQCNRVIPLARHRNVMVGERAKMLFEFGANLRPALAATALFAIGL